MRNESKKHHQYRGGYRSRSGSHLPGSQLRRQLQWSQVQGQAGRRQASEAGLRSQAAGEHAPGHRRRLRRLSGEDLQEADSSHAAAFLQEAARPSQRWQR